MGSNNGNYAKRNDYNKGFNPNNNNFPARDNYNGNQAPKKRSGCGHKRGKTGDREWIVTYGWKKTKSAFLSILAKEYKGSKVTTSENGVRWMTVIVQFTNKTDGTVTIQPGLMRLDTGKVIISGLSWVMNPKAPNNGYIGGYGQKK